MNIFDTIAQSEDFCFFSKKGNAISHSILLFSKDEQYSFMFAKLLACLMLDNKIDKQSLNYQKIMLDAHPDVLYYPKKDKLLVSDSQEIVSESFVKPVFASKKIFILQNIDNSMESAQNKLLKTLEEPCNDVYLILTCANQNLVLPTIKSRCQKKELAKLSDLQILNFISSNQNSNLILSICDGQLGKAIELSKKDNINDIAKLAVDIFLKMKKSTQVLEFSRKIQMFANESNLLLEIICLIVEDLLKIKSGDDKNIKLVEFKEELNLASVDYTVRALCKIVNEINKFQKEISYNVNNVLAIENLLLNILEVKFLCK